MGSGGRGGWVVVVGGGQQAGQQGLVLGLGCEVGGFKVLGTNADNDAVQLLLPLVATCCPVPLLALVPPIIPPRGPLPPPLPSLPSGYACQVAFSWDSRFVMSGDSEGRLFVWDWKTAKVGGGRGRASE